MTTFPLLLSVIVIVGSLDITSQPKISWNDLENNLTRYNYDLPPWTKAGARIMVTTQLIFAHIKSSMISETDLTFHLIEQWTDLRLQYDPNSISFSRKYVLMAFDKYTKIWTPDSYISNAIFEMEHSVTKPNVFIRVYPNGNITKSARITAKIPCRVSVTGFPHGKQVCDLRLKSYAFTSSEVYMEWSKTAYGYSNEFYANGLHVADILPTVCKGTFNVDSQPCLQLNMTLLRNYNSYILRIYVPSGLLVVLGWLSMWIDKNQVGARTSLGVVCVLSLITQIVAVISMAQGLDGIIAVDVWMCSCMIFTIISLAVFAVVHNVKRRSDKLKLKVKYKLHDDIEKGSKKGKSILALTHGKIQKISRIVYPIAFLIFNMAYWTYFLRSS